MTNDSHRGRRRQQLLLFLLDGPATRWELTRGLVEHPNVVCWLPGQVDAELAELRRRGLIDRTELDHGPLPTGRKPRVIWSITDAGRTDVAGMAERIRRAQRFQRPPPPRILEPST